MKICFGIVTDGQNDVGLSRVIQTILDSSIPDKEIIVVGNSSLVKNGVTFLDFDESIKPGWITRKKNLIAMYATGDILVLLHDYIELDFGWNESLLKRFMMNDWEVAVCPISNLDGSRYRDWLIWPHNGIFLDRFFLKTRRCLLPYSCNWITNLMYVSGAFLICKRDFFLANPLDESLVWGEGEDAEWSIRVRNRWRLRCFHDCGVRLQKQKDVLFKEANLIVMAVLYLYSMFTKIRIGSNIMKHNFKSSQFS